MKKYLPAIFVGAAAILLNNVIPTEITVILWLILIALIINKWEVIKKNFS